jgi:hypothetical protein
MTWEALNPSSLCLVVSTPPPLAKAGKNMNSENMLKTATVKDFISLEVIPIPKFGAKIRVQG